MTNSPVFEKFKSLLPYFLLALLIIITYRLSGLFGIFLDFLRWGWHVISPFFYGLLLAYVINIPRGSIHKLLKKTNHQFILKRAKLLSLLSIILIMILLVFIVLNLLIPIIINSVEDFVENSEAYWLTITGFIDNIINLDILGVNLSEIDIVGVFNNIFSGFDFANIDFAAPIQAIAGAASSVFNGAIAFIASIYILVEKDKIKAYANKLLKIFLPEEARITVTEIFVRLNRNLRQYIRTQTIDGISWVLWQRLCCSS
ncbi:MAG: hypothetical protein FWE05_01225 [Defluviitaleaceae bacterium]|nr:hypothetical protein [Defluviitaleaceae bacterium]